VVSNCIIAHNISYFTGGGGAYGGTLNNCTLTDNSVIAGDSGGGAYGCTLNNCTLSGNSVAFDSVNNAPAEAYGGGAAVSTLNNCVLTGNSVSSSGLLSRSHGGGTAYCTLNNCTLTGNWCDPPGADGAYGCTLNNCITYFNNALIGANYDYSSTLNYCCTTTLPINGSGNITNAPLFVDTNGRANLRLQPNSPCINAGDNSYVTNATDLDGNPRIAGGTVDIGAYEYQWPQLTIAPSGPNVLLTWPTNFGGYDYTGFTLQSTTNLTSPVVWSTNFSAPVIISDQNVVTNPISGPYQFYRLVH
jgi:hypothetical protein